MRVLHIVTGFPYSEDEPLTPWLWGLLRRLQERGLEIHVLAASGKGRSGSDLWGFRVHRFRYAPASLEQFTYRAAIPEMLKQNPLWTALVPFYLTGGLWKARKLSRQRFDLVHIHWPFPLALLGWPFRRRNIPVVHTYYTAELTLARRYPRLARWMLRGADLRMAISSYAQKLLLQILPELDPESVAVLPFSAALEQPSFLPPRNRIEGPRLLFVGRMVERKGVGYLLEAVRLLVPEFPGTTLTLVGDGPLRETWEARAKSLGLEDRVRFLGRVSSEQLDQAYTEAEIFVLPAIVDSRGDTEGLGVVLLEALQKGLPVVASAVGGIVDIVVHEKTGLLVPEKDPPALAAAIRRLVMEPALRENLVREGQQRVLQRFSSDAIVSRLWEIYETLLQRRRSAPV